MPSDEHICSMALREAGLTTTIASLDESSPEARACKLFYHNTRDTVLRDHPWNFAQKSKRLSQVAAPDGYDDYDYVYVYPADCIKARVVRASGDKTPREFEVRHHPTEDYRVILTDQAAAILDYTMVAANPDVYDAGFVDALALRLGARLAADLRKDLQTEQALLTKYANFIERARLADKQEGKPDTIEKVPWVEARTVWGRRA